MRETWAAQFIYDDYPPRDIPIDSVVFYRTNDRLKLEIAKGHRDLGKWRPSIHMPRWASRITLEITEVRVERLQEIKERDAIAEGIDEWENMFREYDHPDSNPNWTRDAILSYQTLWDSLNARRGYPWEKNLWVWAIGWRGLLLREINDDEEKK